MFKVKKLKYFVFRKNLASFVFDTILRLELLSLQHLSPIRYSYIHIFFSHPDQIVHVTYKPVYKKRKLSTIKHELYLCARTVRSLLQYASYSF
jgi:hypothetical protein